MLAPGVRGYAILKTNGLLYIPVIEAVAQGSGDVGRFLDSLPLNVRIPNVCSERLEGMLKRRGWTMYIELVEDGPFKGDECDIWEPGRKNGGL